MEENKKMLSLRHTPLLSAIEKNRQLVVYDTIYHKKLHYQYDVLDPFDIKRLNDYTVAIYNEYFDVDYKLLNNMLDEENRVFQILSKYNYVKTETPTNNNVKNDSYNIDEINVLQELRKIIMQINKNPKLEEKYDDNVVVNRPIRRLQLSKPRIPRMPVNSVCNYKLKIPTKTISDDISLYNFETMAFGNRTAFSLYPDCLFSTYFYQNTLYSLNVPNGDSLKNDNRWQAKLASLLYHTNFSEYVALEAFYVNTVTANGIVYDTSFVPKYKVKDLKRRAYRLNLFNWQNDQSNKGTFEENTDTVSDEYIQKNEICSNKSCEYVKYIDSDTMFAYRDRLDVRKEQFVPKRYLKIFSIFPFKDGHYVDTDGKIHAVYFDKPESMQTVTSLVGTLRQIYRAKNTESAIYECADMYKFKQLLSFVLYNNNLDLQGMCLIVLRAMCGNYIRIENSILQLPYANEVFAWLKRYCSGNKCVNYSQNKNTVNIILFPKEPNTRIDVTQALITDSYTLIKNIARTAKSELDCSFICSRYSIAPVIYSSLYDKLTTHAEIYVFLTIAIQKTNLNAYREHREKLKPEWIADLSHDSLFASSPSSTNTRDFPYASFDKLVERERVQTIKPTDLNCDIVAIRGMRETLDKYEFTDRRLRELIQTGITRLTNFEILSLLTIKLAANREKTAEPGTAAVQR